MKEVSAHSNIEQRLNQVLTILTSAASSKIRLEMGPRYGIVVDRAFGVSMGALQRIAKPFTGDHELAEALWEVEWYETRIIACLIADPSLVTFEQMDRWRADFDNWAIVDAACFKLFDRVEGAALMVKRWSSLNDEFGRRAAFALLACLALHGRGEQADFLDGLRLVETAATDERNFVKKGVNWALRAIGGKSDPVLRTAARDVAERLAASSDKTARWNGKSALRAFRRGDAKMRSPERS